MTVYKLKHKCLNTGLLIRKLQECVIFVVTYFCELSLLCLRIKVSLWYFIQRLNKNVLQLWSNWFTYVFIFWRHYFESHTIIRCLVPSSLPDPWYRHSVSGERTARWILQNDVREREQCDLSKQRFKQDYGNKYIVIVCQTCKLYDKIKFWKLHFDFYVFCFIDTCILEIASASILLTID